MRPRSGWVANQRSLTAALSRIHGSPSNSSCELLVLTCIGREDSIGYIASLLPFHTREREQLHGICFDHADQNPPSSHCPGRLEDCECRRPHQACNTYGGNGTLSINPSLLGTHAKPCTKDLQFDDIQFTPEIDTPLIPDPYDGLNFSAFTLANTTYDASSGGHQLIIPKSNPNYIVAPDLFDNPLAANISIPPDSPDTSFDLIDFWVACIDTVLRSVTSCNIVVNSTAAADGLQNVPFLFTYEPARKANDPSVAPMTKITTNLFLVKDVAIGFIDTSQQTVFRTQIFLDSFKYNLPSKYA